MECGTVLAPTPEAPPSAATVPVAAEKKHITVLFADVQGSMDLQGNRDLGLADIERRTVALLQECP
jgi:class 3 adenylate cyclase